MTFLYAFPNEFDLAEGRILSALDAYLSGFGDDGISPEGPELRLPVLHRLCRAVWEKARRSRDYFGAERMKYLVTSSRGHSVPIIDGTYQYEGEKYRSIVLRSGSGVFEADIAGAYGGAAKSIVRKFTVSDDFIELCDDFIFDENSGSHTVTERFVSVIKPEIHDGKAVIGSLLLDCAPPCITGSERYINHNSKEDILYFTDYKLDCGSKAQFRIKFRKKD